MSNLYVKTKRQGTSWDPDFKEPFVKDLQAVLERMTHVNRVDNKEVFMLCLAIGFEAELKRDVPPRRTDAVRLSYLKDEDLALFRSIALSDSQNPDVLLNEDSVYDIVEQYAAGGLMILAEKIQKDANFADWLTQKLYVTTESYVTQGNATKSGKVVKK